MLNVMAWFHAWPKYNLLKDVQERLCDDPVHRCSASFDPRGQAWLIKELGNAGCTNDPAFEPPTICLHCQLWYVDAVLLGAQFLYWCLFDPQPGRSSVTASIEKQSQWSWATSQTLQRLSYFCDVFIASLKRNPLGWLLDSKCFTTWWLDRVTYCWHRSVQVCVHRLFGKQSSHMSDHAKDRFNFADTCPFCKTCRMVSLYSM